MWLTGPEVSILHAITLKFISKILYNTNLTTWLMEPGGSVSVQKNSPIIQIPGRMNPVPSFVTNLFKIHSYILLSSTPWSFQRFLSVGFPVKIFKAHLLSSILATWSSHPKLLDLTTLTVWGERYNLWSSSLWSLFTPHTHPSWAKILTSGSCFQITLACVPPLM